MEWDTTRTKFFNVMLDECEASARGEKCDYAPFGVLADWLEELREEFYAPTFRLCFDLRKRPAWLAHRPMWQWSWYSPDADEAFSGPEFAVPGPLVPAMRRRANCGGVDRFPFQYFSEAVQNLAWAVKELNASQPGRLERYRLKLVEYVS